MPKKDLVLSDVEKVVDLKFKGISTMDVAKELNMSYYQVRNISRSPEFKLEMGKALCSRAARLGAKIVDLLEKKIDEGDLEAVKVALKLIVPNDTNVQTDQITTLQVILPSSEPLQKVIDITNE